MANRSTQSLVAGILSLVLFFTITYYGGLATMIINGLVALMAIVFGILGLKTATSSADSTKAFAGIALGAATVLIAVILVVFNT